MAIIIIQIHTFVRRSNKIISQGNVSGWASHFWRAYLFSPDRSIWRHSFRIILVEVLVLTNSLSWSVRFAIRNDGRRPRLCSGNNFIDLARQADEVPRANFKALYDWSNPGKTMNLHRESNFLAMNFQELICQFKYASTSIELWSERLFMVRIEGLYRQESSKEFDYFRSPHENNKTTKFRDSTKKPCC